ncbi:WG repeat-containing protein [Paenibacillus hamazuiensis]|uniref:WG repeat-containing protein n=1 Tax=Paenibacillus hamazuiensis TaxID=2936508 RepID=UPI00200F2496|nr:WG repeat-containing protein [Paenibacillus hamazuiensis]
MIANETQIRRIRMHLPQGAELLTIERPFPHPAAVAADLDGDGIAELAGAYRLEGQVYVIVLKRQGSTWIAAARLHNSGYNVTVLTAATVSIRNRQNLLVGWQAGASWSQLSVYDWAREGVRDIAPADTYFSFLETEDMPGPAGRDGLAELALWIHDTGDAYRVEVIRRQHGRWTEARDVYPHYFRRVAGYYERMVRRFPDYGFYWYYLADAQIKVGMRNAAIASLRKALSFRQPYPSREKLEQMLEQLEAGAATRGPALFPASVKTASGTKWGYIDSQGRMVIRPQYDDALDFQDNGLAIVQVNGRSGLIDTSGHFADQPVYDSISPFSEGRAVVIDKQGFKLMDTSGRIVTGKAYDYISAVRGGRAVFSEVSGGVNRYGYLDLQGREVIPAQYMQADDFHDGKAVVKVKEGEFVLIDPSGKRLAAYPYSNVGSLREGLMPFQKEQSGRMGYIDEQGHVVISPAYTGALPFRDGRAVVSTAENYNYRYGLIDRQGKIIIHPEFNDIRQLGEMRVAVGKPVDPAKPYVGSLFAIADNDGRFLTDYQYYDVTEYERGLASAYDRTHTFFIDKSGLPAPGLPRLSGSGNLRMADGLIQANVDQRLSYLNRSGRAIWSQNTVIPLVPPYRIKEEKYKPNKDYLVYYPQIEGMADTAAQQKANATLREMSGVKSVPAGVQLDYSYTGDFDVTFFQKHLVVLNMNAYNFPFGAAHGMPSKLYAHVDLASSRFYELKDLFKPGRDYVQVLSGIVGRKIKEDPQYSYVFPGSYKGIKPNQPFYVTQNALHLYFEPYEIAPYAAGFPTFTIPYAEIMTIIAVDEPFWRSFH